MVFATISQDKVNGHINGDGSHGMKNLPDVWPNTLSDLVGHGM
jgi:hypothetical protein